jgi:hypothetical protein
MAPDEGDWVELRRCTVLHEAHFIRSLLESEGIDALITGEHSVAVQPFLGVMPGAIPVLVRATDLDRARELLDSAEKDLQAPPDDG